MGYEKTNIIINLITLIFLLFLIGIYFSKKKAKNIENKLFKNILLWSFIELNLSILYQYLSLTMSNEILIDIILSLNIASILIYIMYLTAYIITFTNNFNKDFLTYLDKNNDKINIALLILPILMIIISLLLPNNLIYINNELKILGINKYYFLIVSIIFVAIDLYCIIRNKQNLSKKKLSFFYISGILEILAFLILGIYPVLSIFPILMTLVTYLLYHLISNPDINLIDKLEKDKNKAENFSKSKNDFLTSISHEIRTPLNSIIGLSEVVEKSDDVEEIHSDIKDILVASQSILDIIEGILDINKIESNKLEMKESNYNPRDIFEEVIKFIRMSADSKEIEIKTNYSSELPLELYGDKNKIKRIITNLLTNSTKYTKKGYIDFNVECQNTRDECELIFTIKDTGCGINKELKEKVIQSFNNLDNREYNDINGTCSGLAVTKSLVDLFGGKITLESVYGSGTTFKVTLKQRIINDNKNEFSYNSYANNKVNEEIKHQETETLEVQDLPKSSVESNENITNTTEAKPHLLLVVDDNNVNLKVASRMISTFNYPVEQAHGGIECLEKVKQNKGKYDLIFMDIMMPDLDGVTTMKKLKEMEDFDTPIVALTADSMEGSREKYLAVGFDEYISKPLIKQILQETLGKYIDIDDIIIKSDDELDNMNSSDSETL